MRHKIWFCLSLFALAIIPQTLKASQCFDGSCGDDKVCGKVDVGPAYVHIDLLNEGDTIDKMDIPAIRGDACWCFWKGLSLKPMILWGKNNNENELFTTGIGLGHVTPVWGKKLYLTPVVGINYTYLTTSISYPQFGLSDIRHKFYSYAPYVALEATWNIAKAWRIYGSVQYAWTRNRNWNEFLGTTKEHSTGWNYSGLIEYDLNKCWSVNAGGAYNNSYSHEKDGIRAYGFKLGIVRWF